MNPLKGMNPMTTVYTIGHSTHPIEEFIEMLEANGVKQLVDIRTVPGSRHNPQYGQKALEKSMEEAGIRYVYLKSLGGLRPKVKNSVNMGWRNESFRNYADYMQTDEFKEGVEELIRLAKKKTTVIMCAEAVPWRCHRSLVGDALLVRDVKVLDIMSKTKTTPHKMIPFAVTDGTKITYPKDDRDEKE